MPPRLSRRRSTAPVGNREKSFSIAPKRHLLRVAVFLAARFLNRVPASTARGVCTSPGYPLFHAQRVLLRSISLLSPCFLEASLVAAFELVLLSAAKDLLLSSHTRSHLSPPHPT